MKFTKTFFVIFLLIYGFYCVAANAQNQNTSQPKQIKILNNYGHIPFEDGKTTIVEVKFTGFDSDYEQYEQTLGKQIRENEFLSELKWKKAIINVGEKFSGAKVAKAIKLLKNWISEKGYLNAEVIAFGEELPKNQMKLIFSVKRNFPAFVSKIHFDGNKNVSSEELVENFKECLGDRKLFDARAYDYFANICSRQLLFSKGFFQAKIHSITPRRVANSYVIEISLVEGVRYIYGTIKFEGATVFSEKELTEMLGWKTGDIANGKHLQDSLYEKLKKEYANRGYIDYNADFDLTYIEPQAEGLDGIVNIVVKIEEYRQFDVGKIEFVGIDEDEARKLKELIPLNVGEVYNQSKFEEGIKKINELKEFYPIDFDRNVDMRVPQYREGIVMGGLIIGENPRLKYRDENILKETPSLDLIISTRRLTEDERKNYK